jgi:hypothetical protein
VWTALPVNSFTVTFSDNGGTGILGPQTASGATDLTTNNGTITRSGYSFAGWDTSAGTTVVYTDGERFDFTANTTLYAVWTALPVNVVIGVPVPSIPVPTVSITIMPSSAVYGGTFTPTYTTSGDGKAFTVTSSTTSVCTVSSDGTTLNYVGVGTCTLTSAVASTADYAAATGLPQSFTIGQATPTVSISNMPVSPQTGGSFPLTFTTSGDGTAFSVISSTLTVCTVSGVNVNFVGAGTCSLIVTVAPTADYLAASSTVTTLSTSPAKASSTHNLGRVYFAFNKSGVDSVKSRNTIESAARAIKAHKYVLITVTAYTDKVGTHSYNLALSARRAANVVALLKKDLAALHYTKAVVRGTGKGATTASSVVALERVAIMVVVR